LPGDYPKTLKLISDIDEFKGRWKAMQAGSRIAEHPPLPGGNGALSIYRSGRSSVSNRPRRIASPPGSSSLTANVRVLSVKGVQREAKATNSGDMFWWIWLYLVACLGMAILYVFPS
jgi:hypothetical protein